MERRPDSAQWKNRTTLVYILSLLSLLSFAVARFALLSRGRGKTDEMIRASQIMQDAESTLRTCLLDKGLLLDELTDINRTGLIGLESSPITTSLGDLEAKRTTTNPNFAALVVLLLSKAGVRRGDTIAVGASGSFPALILAVLSAAKAMNLKPLMICSLGASQWGANNPDFGWLEIQACLETAVIFAYRPIAISLGGEGDTGQDMSPRGRAFLLQKIQKTGIFFINETDLGADVKTRMRLYKESAGPFPVRAFINIGGSWANMGTDPSILKLKPGLARVDFLPVPGKRGVLQEMAGLGTPVIHLLHIKGIARRYGLPWDPSPLPRPGEGDVYRLAKRSGALFLTIVGLYFFFVVLLIAIFY